MKQNSLFSILNKEASLDTFLQLFQNVLGQIKAKFRLILFLILLGASIGAITSLVKPVKYRAEIIFGAQEKVASGFEGLMSQFGLDIGGMNPGGVFEGESLLKVFETRSIIEKSLLRKAKIGNDSVVLAQFLLANSKYGSKSVFKDVKFTADRTTYNSITDSALFLLYKHLLNNLMSVSKPDKRQGVFYLNVVHPNPQFSMVLCESILAEVSHFYIESLTQKARQNLNILQLEADSVKRSMNQSFNYNATEADLNVNPIKQELRVNQNKKMVDLQISIALYGEVVKNLKLAEIGLRKQTPLIQIIDRPHMPLEKSGLELWEWTLIGAFFGFLFSLFLVYSSNQQSETLGS